MRFPSSSSPIKRDSSILGASRPGPTPTLLHWLLLSHDPVLRRGTLIPALTDTRPLHLHRRRRLRLSSHILDPTRNWKKLDRSISTVITIIIIIIITINGLLDADFIWQDTEIVGKKVSVGARVLITTAISIDYGRRIEAARTFQWRVGKL